MSSLRPPGLRGADHRFWWSASDEPRASGARLTSGNEKIGWFPYDRRSYFVVCRARRQASGRFSNGARLRSSRLGFGLLWGGRPPPQATPWSPLSPKRQALVCEAAWVAPKSRADPWSAADPQVGSPRKGSASVSTRYGDSRTFKSCTREEGSLTGGMRIRL